MKLLVNKAQCSLCNDIIESKTVHNFVCCKCGAIFVDGGKDYARRGFTNSPDEIIDLSIYEKDEDEPII